MIEIKQYAQNVLLGDIVAGNLVRLACKRFLDDLDNQGTKEFPYVFDEEKACKIINFFQHLRYTDGEPGFAGTEIRLPSFAKFILGNIFGWVHMETGYRRFRRSYVQVARKNIKSMLNGGMALYLAGFDNYENAQVYCTATKMKQARIVWGQASKFIQQDSDLAELFKVRNHDAEIECLLNGSKVMALGRDVHTIDGFDPHGGIIDEYHSHDTSQMLKLLEDGTVNQRESLISIITTAGFNLNSPCYEEYKYCVNALETKIYNDSYFIYIAQMDKDDDIWAEKNWIKANPLVAALPQGMENLRRFSDEAKTKEGEDLRNFMTKSLNIWVQQADNQYISLDDWEKCGSDMTLDCMSGKSCVVGLDLSSGGDLTSVALEFTFMDNGAKKYYIHSHSFMPSKRLWEHIKTDKVPYDMWHRNKLITITETLGGLKTDYKYIIQYLKDIKEKYNITFTAIAYDPHNASAFLSDLEAFGANCIMIQQSARSLNDATWDFALEVKAQNIIYDKRNTLLTWSIANAVTVSNSFGEIKIEKDLKTKRIDPVDAVIDAHKIAMSNPAPKYDPTKYTGNAFLSKLWG